MRPRHRPKERPFAKSATRTSCDSGGHESWPQAGDRPKERRAPIPRLDRQADTFLTATSTVTCLRSVRVVALLPVGGCGIPSECWLRFPVFLALRFFCALSSTVAVFPVRLLALSLVCHDFSQELTPRVFSMLLGSDF